MKKEAATKSYEDIDIGFKEKSVYYYWHVVSRDEWRFADDPVDSAREFISERGKEHQVALLDVTPAPGVRVVAFQVTDFMEACGKSPRELAMDSTCKYRWNNMLSCCLPSNAVGTNGNNCELFAAVSAVKGSGIPLAYCLIQTSDQAGKGAKEATLQSFLDQLKKLGVNPEYTLSDKDWSEINAMRAVWPNAKHQLCFWHALRALKQRMSKNKDTPAPYNPSDAQAEFSFIDITFVPVSQHAGEPVCALLFRVTRIY